MCNIVKILCVSSGNTYNVFRTLSLATANVHVAEDEVQYL